MSWNVKIVTFFFQHCFQVITIHNNRLNHYVNVGLYIYLSILPVRSFITFIIPHLFVLLVVDVLYVFMNQGSNFELSWGMWAGSCTNPILTKFEVCAVSYSHILFCLDLEPKHWSPGHNSKLKKTKRVCN